MISDLEAAILGLICEGHSYGYELEKEIDERDLRNWTEIAFSSIYYILKKLKKQGYITSSSKNVNGRSRTVYAVTPQGTQAMEEKVSALISQYHSLTDPFNLGLSNLDKISPDEVVKGLESYRAALGLREEYLRLRLVKSEELRWPIYVKGLIERSKAKTRAEKEWLDTFQEEVVAYYKDKGLM